MRISAFVLLAGLAGSHCFVLPTSRTAIRASRPRHATRLAAESHDGFVSRRSVLAGTAAITWAAIASAAAPARVNAATLAKKTQVLGDIEKSPNDSRAYRASILPNGLRVLLYSVTFGGIDCCAQMRKQ
eukprot:18727-Heterococcus_DN1.PRE.7